MGFPTFATAARPLLVRAALIGVMLGGGLLYAGISQAQDAGDISAERSAELVAATGGPATGAHLVVFARDRAAVEAREDDVAALPASPAAPQAQPPAAPAASPSEVPPSPASPGPASGTADGSARRVASADPVAPQPSR